MIYVLVSNMVEIYMRKIIQNIFKIEMLNS